MPSKNTRRDTLVARRRKNVEYYCNGVLKDNTQATEYDTVQTYRLDKTWTNAAGYHSLVRAGARVPDQSLTVEHETRPESVIHYDYSYVAPTCPGPWELKTREGFYEHTFGNGAALRDTGARTLSNDAAISSLLSKAKGAEFSVPVFLGEARETVSMVLKTAETLATAYRHLRRGRVVEAFRTVKMNDPNPRVVRSFNRQYGADARAAAANHWLAMQYGWKPLLNDVKNAAEQLAELTERQKIGRVTGYSQKVSRFSGPVQVEVSPVTMVNRLSITKESVRAVWLFSPTELNDLGSLGLLNPLSVAWELLPLSFVVDWMLPIGRYLEHLDVPLRFHHIGGCIGYRRDVSTINFDFVRDGVKGSGSHSSRYVRVERTPFGGVPSLGLDSIRFEPKLGVQRMLSGLALASQAFKR